ncbi:MAG: hypothetical protein ACTHLR_14920 [Rhizomicrobium sp.]
MNFAIFSPKTLTSLGTVILCAVGLSGCFDLGQKVAIGRDGSGGYAISVAADGMLGRALKDHHSDIDIGDDDLPMRTHIAVIDGKTVQTSGVAFRDLSDLRLGDESMSLRVKGKKLLGLGGTEVNFHRAFNIERAPSSRRFRRRRSWPRCPYLFVRRPYLYLQRLAAGHDRSYQSAFCRRARSETRYHGRWHGPHSHLAYATGGCAGH